MIEEKLRRGLIREAFMGMLDEAAGIEDRSYLHRIEALQEEFRYMKDFMLKGYHDPQREQMYDSLVQRIISLNNEITACRNLQKSGKAYSWLAPVKGRDVSPEALMSQLLAPSSPEEHFGVLSAAFASQARNGSWSNAEQQEWTDFLLSPQTSVIDASAIITAITLSCMEIFCRQKAMCLADIFLRTSSEQVRQRAFVGCLFALHNAPEYYKADVADVVGRLREKEGIESDVVELQMLAARCANADSDSQKIARDMMPDIMKAQPYLATGKGFAERSSDDDGVDLGAMEQQMEKMEESISKIRKMQDGGADVFYTGFKQTKRSAFFYDPVNWIIPFYPEHPGIAKEMATMACSRFVERMTTMAPFCNSDKYSFVITFASVATSLPEQIRKMMENGQLGPIGMPEQDAFNPTPAFIRRMYLQDLFRYARLFGDAAVLNDVFTSIRDEKSLWAFFVPFMHNQYFVAEYYFQKKDYAPAVSAYQRYLAEHPNHKPSMRSLAKAYFELKEYDKASFYFDALHTLEPKRISHSLNYCMAMVNSGKAQDVINELYRVDYENPDNVNIQNTLGWALLYAGKADNAARIYARLPEEVKMKDFSVLLNAVYALLATGGVGDAVAILRRYMSTLSDEQRDAFPATLLKNMSDDADMLSLYGICRAEKVIIAEAVSEA